MDYVPAMKRSPHSAVFALSVLWTLALLLLGSIVHATESSLACPDWPTCFGTMMPEMTGGVFWEHLHRLWAGALVLIFLAAVVLQRRGVDRRAWLFKAGLAGLALLVIQSLLGGLTVLLQLPDAISTSHLTLALLFLALATVLAVTTGPRWGTRDAGDGGRSLRAPAIVVAGLVLVQSVVGALVRHTDAGMACPDVPLCLGRWVPVFEHPLVALHYGHRVVGIGVGIAAVALVVATVRRAAPSHFRRLAWGVLTLVAVQIVLGFVSVATALAVAPVSVAHAAGGLDPDAPDGHGHAHVGGRPAHRQPGADPGHTGEHGWTLKPSRRCSRRSTPP